ncbi:MAG: hypothetical protein IPP72_09860 [Chitinophagaceae bacterium]|nr:hypothetical protein [Chitinophagaceae bacterium]
MRIFCLLGLFCLAFSVAGAQQLYFNHLSVNNGLTQGVNNCIFKDSKGFVWISSFDGLNRFDGIDCKKYYSSPNQQKGIRGTLFLNILEDRSECLWIGSNDGLNYYDRKTDSFYCYRIMNSSSGEQFCSPFYIDHRNRIWLQSRFDIFIFDPAVKSFTRLNGIPFKGNAIIKTFPLQLYKPVESLFMVTNNSPVLWKGIVSGENINWQRHELSVKGITVNTLLLAGSNSCWLGTSSGLYRLDMNAPTASCNKINGTNQISISSLHLDNTGTMWIGSLEYGLLKADSAGNILQHYSSKADNGYSLSGNQVIYIYTDDNRNLWVAVWGKGIDYTNLDKFHFNQFISKAAAADFLSDNFIRSIAGINNEIWCATQSGGLLVLDSTKKIKETIRSALPPSVEYLLADDNKIWAATFKGLFQVDAITKVARKVAFVNTPSSNAASLQYNYICKLQKGQFLLSSNAGLYIAVKEGAGYRSVLVKGADATDVYLTAYAGDGGLLYISKAFKGFGIYRLQNDSLVSIRQFPLQATIKCFSDTPDSLLWIGSTVGLIRFNKKVSEISRIYTTNDGLSNQYVYGVVQDGEYLWLSTNAGINRFHPSGPVVKIFTAADGLQSNEYNTYSFYKTAGGEILFGGINGLNGFYPSVLKPFNAVPKLVLSSIQLNDTVYNPLVNYSALKELNVDYKQNTLGFQFTVIDYVNAAAAHISYMLEGYDKGWVNATNKSFIRYVNLPPGNYTLKLKAFNADGVMAEKVYQLPVTVRAPWWQSWWFRLLMAVVTVAAMVVVVKTYLQRKLQKQKILMEKELAVEQERIRMARELHDGLGSMLSGIKHSFSAIKNDITLNRAQQNKFEYTIDKLDDSIRDLRAVSHTMFSAELLQEGLEAAIRNYCMAVSTTAGIHIAFENIMQQPTALKGEQAFHIFRVVQELVQNIVKHSKATEAIVQLSYNNGILSVTVEDNGVGFNAALHHGKNGIGLKNVESRIKMLHGKTDIQSHPGKGTSVFIEVPV